MLLVGSVVPCDSFRMANYNDAVVMGSSLLAVKIGTLHFLTVRSRLLSGDFATGRPQNEAWKEEGKMLPIYAKMFTCMLCAIGPSPSTDRFTGLVANAVENEPYFMALAVAIATLGKPSPMAATLVKTYVAGRYFHALVYLTEFPEVLQPHKTFIRAQGFLAGQAALLGLALSQLL